MDRIKAGAFGFRGISSGGSHCSPPRPGRAILPIHHFLFILAIGLVIGLLIFGSPGCASQNKSTKAHAFTSAPHQLSGVDHSLGWLVVAGVLGISAAGALYLFAPEEHQLSIAVAGGSGVMMGLSLLLKSTLWVVPWIGYCGLALTVIIAGYEIWIHYIRRTPAQGSTTKAGWVESIIAAPPAAPAT